MLILRYCTDIERCAFVAHKEIDNDYIVSKRMLIILKWGWLMV